MQTMGVGTEQPTLPDGQNVPPAQSIGEFRMTSKRFVRSSLYFVGICVAALGLSVTRGQEQRANGRQSAAALKAESDYQDALAAAGKEYPVVG